MLVKALEKCKYIFNEEKTKKSKCSLKNPNVYAHTIFFTYLSIVFQKILGQADLIIHLSSTAAKRLCRTFGFSDYVAKSHLANHDCRVFFVLVFYRDNWQWHMFVNEPIKCS